MFSVSKQSSFLFLVIATILLSSPLMSVTAFADSDDDQHEGKVNKKSRVWTGDGPPIQKLGKLGDLYIDNHNSIYNIYKKTAKSTWTDVPDMQGTLGPQGPQGLPGISPTVETEPLGENCSEGGLKITDSFFDVFYVCNGIPGLKGEKGDQGPPGMISAQTCPSNHYVSGIDSNGILICTSLPDFTPVTAVCGNAIVESSEQCDLGSGNGATSSCSASCIIQTPDLCLGVDIDDGNECTTDACSVGVPVHTDNGFCTEAVCGDGAVSAGEACDDGNMTSGDGCSNVCSIEGCNANTNPLCSSATVLNSVSGDQGEDFYQITNNGENWYSLTIREDSSFGGPPEATISLVSNNGDNYDLYVYCETCGGTFIGSSTFVAGLTDFVQVRSITDNAFTGDDTFTILIEVRAVSVNSCSDYTLTVAGNIVDEFYNIALC